MISLILAAALSAEPVEVRVCTPVNHYGERPATRQCHNKKAEPAPKVLKAKTKAPKA
ncbi:hypothetical protein [Gallaecimonas sp. GXIMD4217]|uniref:hypothetical protein n=1 Tax=Gallaecimonas sp. GXIMD4217 TaxID=3131927 RepID=UPI00311B3F4D